MAKKTLSLQELARELRVTPKTLTRYLEIAQIEPTEDPRDRRKRVVDQDQASQIKELFGAEVAPDTAVLESHVVELREQVGTLQVEVARLSAWLAAVADNVTSLTQRSLGSEQSQGELTHRLEEISRRLDQLARTPAHA